MYLYMHVYNVKMCMCVYVRKTVLTVRCVGV